MRRCRSHDLVYILCPLHTIDRNIDMQQHCRYKAILECTLIHGVHANMHDAAPWQNARAVEDVSFCTHVCAPLCTNANREHCLGSSGHQPVRKDSRADSHANTFQYIGMSTMRMWLAREPLVCVGVNVVARRRASHTGGVAHRSYQIYVTGPLRESPTEHSTLSD